MQFGRFRFTRKERYRFSNTPAIVPAPVRIISTPTGKVTFIPDEVLKVFDNEFDYRETVNSRDLTDMAAALFVGILDTPAVLSGGSGAVPTTCLGEDARTNGNGHADAPVKRQE